MTLESDTREWTCRNAPTSLGRANEHYVYFVMKCASKLANCKATSIWLKLKQTHLVSAKMLIVFLFFRIYSCFEIFWIPGIRYLESIVWDRDPEKPQLSIQTCTSVLLSDLPRLYFSFVIKVITEHSVLMARLRVNRCNNWEINVIISCDLSNWTFFQYIYHRMRGEGVGFVTSQWVLDVLFREKPESQSMR